EMRYARIGGELGAIPAAEMIPPIVPKNDFFFFSSKRRHTRSVSAFLLNRSSDLNCRGFGPLLEDRKSGSAGMPNRSSGSAGMPRSEERRVGKECRSRWSAQK